MFEQLDSGFAPNLVVIFNAKQNKVFGIYDTADAMRMEPTGKTVVTFEERAANAPQAIDTWFFYPGDTIGFQFLYPHAKTAHQNSLAKVITSTRHRKNG